MMLTSSWTLHAILSASTVAVIKSGHKSARPTYDEAALTTKRMNTMIARKLVIPAESIAISSSMDDVYILVSSSCGDAYAFCTMSTILDASAAQKRTTVSPLGSVLCMPKRMEEVNRSREVHPLLTKLYTDL